ETWGRAAALLEFLLAGGRAGIDQDVADAELFNEAEGFLAGAGADGEHADDAADAEDDAEGSEESAGLLGAQVGDGLAEVGEKNHRGPPGAARVEKPLGDSGSADRGQTGLTANFRQTAPEIHVSLVSPREAPVMR